MVTLTAASAQLATIDRHHCYYLYNQDLRVRESTFLEQCVLLAENLNEGGHSSTNVVVVKGRIAFSGICYGSPLPACIDYMHCDLIGVYQSFLKLPVMLMTGWKNLEGFIKLVNKNSLSCELFNHGWSFRPLTDLKVFKVNEFLNNYFTSALSFCGVGVLIKCMILACN